MAKIAKVAVIGGGVIGTTTALLALEKVPNIEVTLIAEKFSPFTTGDGSAGFWTPYLVGCLSEEKLKFWGQKTFQFLQDIFKSPDASKYGVGLLSCYDVSTGQKVKKIFRDVYLDFRPMNSKELALFPARYKEGVFYTTYFAECTKLLPIFMKRIKNLGGKIVRKKVENLSELCGKYDVIINCCGLGAAQLANDPDVKPIRGQVMRVRAPWIKHAIMDDEFYILPNSDEIICGGTHQEGDWNLEVDPVDSQRIWEGCTDLVPSLKGAEVLREWVGLRPGRFQPRLERETLKTANGNIEVIHNYGHGGAGITISWGCAHDAVKLLEGALNDLTLKRILSNL